MPTFRNWRPRSRTGLRAASISTTVAALVLAAAHSAPAVEPGGKAPVNSPEGRGSAIATVTTPAVTRATMISRAQTWVDAAVPYDQTAYRDGYRTDCSGYISMAWMLGGNLTTQTLDSVSHPISKADLRAGDILLWKNPTGGQGHVAMFEKWADASHTSYWTYEQAGGHTTAHHVIPYPYYSGSGPYYPFRYNNVKEVSSVPATADVTGDRKDDLLGMKDGRLYLHRSNAAGDFGAGEVRLERGYNRDWLGTADMGGKGLVSVLGRSNGRLYRYLNNGTSDFGSSQVMLDHGYNYTQLFTGDYNGDGYTDLFGMKDGRLSVFVNNKANDFASAKLLGDRGYNRDWLGAADLNGDGYDDVLGRTSGRLYVYTNNKAGDFGASRLLADHGYNYETLLTADINYDGKDDVLGETAGLLYAFKSTGTDFGARTPLANRGYTYTALIS